jgi:transcriptional regulator with XRE-family HTH domain
LPRRRQQGEENKDQDRSTEATMSHRKLLSPRRKTAGLPDRRERLSAEYGARRAEFPHPEGLTLTPQGEESGDSREAEAEVTSIAVALLRWRSGLNRKDFAARSRMSRQRLAAYENALQRAKDETLERLLAGAGLRPSRLGRLLAVAREARQALGPERPLPARDEIEALVQGFVGRVAELSSAALRQLAEGVLAVDRGTPWDENAVPCAADRRRAPLIFQAAGERIFSHSSQKHLTHRDEVALYRTHLHACTLLCSPHGSGTVRSLGACSFSERSRSKCRER